MTGFIRIPLNGWKAGKSGFSWHLGKAFFQSFGNSEVLDADLTVQAEGERAGGPLLVDVRLEGRLVVACDRCQEDLAVPVARDLRLVVRTGPEPGREEVREDGREAVYVGADELAVALDQVVYDYACLSVPMHHVHPEGGCNPLALARLCREETDGIPGAESRATDSPFAALKGLLEGKEQ